MFFPKIPQEVEVLTLCQWLCNFYGSWNTSCMCGCFGNICTCIYCGFVLFYLYIFILFMLLFNFVSYVFWHVYVLGPAYFVWPWKSSVPHRTIRDITPGPLSATDTCIVYHVTHIDASRNVILHPRYVSTCVGAGCGRGRETMNKSYLLWRMLL
jgi:hypothetical protein